MNLNNILGFTLKSQTVEMKWLLILMFTLKTLCLGHLENRGYDIGPIEGQVSCFVKYDIGG